jgi:octaprenyl-diphosphate synthase
MDSLKRIAKPVADELNQFEPYFKASLKSNVPLLDIITNYVIRRKGKQMRPLLVFLSAGLAGNINPKTKTAAAFIELLHTATLIHDDVVDSADTRRGFFSVKALWKSKIAVLVGDFMLSKGLLLAVENEAFDILKIVSEAVREMAEGELLQIEKSRKLDISEEVYFEIITKKTATLTAACTAAGAQSAGAEKQILEKMKLFGQYAGIAFQIKDDLFDYQKTSVTGKPAGNDIQEKKMTLPLIYALNKASQSEKRQILRIVGSSKKTSKKIEEVYEFVRQKGGLQYTENKMLEYRDKALAQLDIFEESEIKTSLRELIFFITVRNS